MEKHTRAALWRTAALFLIAPWVFLITMALLQLDNEAGRVFGAIVVAAAGWIWWLWLRVDAPLNSISASSVLAWLVLYIVIVPLAVVGYLFHSRGLSDGITSASWFVLDCVTLVAALFAEAVFLRAIFSSFQIAF